MEENQNTQTAETKVTASAQQENESHAKSENGSKMYTQEEVNKLFDARFARESRKWEQRLTESQKMTEMNAEQKAQYQQKKYEKELEEREAEITKRELRATAKEVLAEKGLPADLFEVLNYNDAETCTAGIDALEKAFRSAVDKAVDDRVRKSGGTPKTGESKSRSGVEAKFYELNPQLKK